MEGGQEEERGRKRKNRNEGRKEEKKGEWLPSARSFPKGLQWQVVSRAGVQNHLHVSHLSAGALWGPLLLSQAC